ncbi:mCG144545, partial [Mus musculus]
SVRPHHGLESREPSAHWTGTEARDHTRRPSGFLGESHAKWRGSRAELKGQKLAQSAPGHQDFLRVQLLVTESPETAEPFPSLRCSSRFCGATG